VIKRVHNVRKLAALDVWTAFKAVVIVFVDEASKDRRAQHRSDDAIRFSKRSLRQHIVRR
jgi:hypothetical protein